MQYKTLLCCLMLALPTIFMGQVLQEINDNPTDLPDPDNYPFEIYFKAGFPVASLTIETGHKNMRQIFQDGGIEMPNEKSVNIFGVGIRYKRFFTELNGATQLFDSPIPFLFANRFSVSSSYMIVGANIGYAVWQNRNSAVILRVGAGGGGSSYFIRSLADARQIDFDELLTQDTGGSSSLIYHEDTFWDVSIELWRGRSKSRTSFGESASIGFRRGFIETAWETLDTPSVNAPLDRRVEIYFNAAFHLGQNFPKKVR